MIGSGSHALENLRNLSSPLRVRVAWSMVLVVQANVEHIQGGDPRLLKCYCAAGALAVSPVAGCNTFLLLCCEVLQLLQIRPARAQEVLHRFLRIEPRLLRLVPHLRTLRDVLASEITMCDSTRAVSSGSGQLKQVILSTLLSRFVILTGRLS
jgi:hypothetical protein